MSCSNYYTKTILSNISPENASYNSALLLCGTCIVLMHILHIVTLVLMYYSLCVLISVK